MRISLLRSSQSADISDAALKHTTVKNSDTGTRENSTPDDAEDNEDPTKPSFEQAEREDGRASPDEQAVNDDSKDCNYMPLSEDEASLGDKDFIVPEEPVE